MNKTKLYHCTKFKCLYDILESGQFLPSYCYERAEYLDEPMGFAFAMVCFADLLKSEVKSHLKTFNKGCYIQMSKDWAMRNALSNVIYYNKNNVISASFKRMINEILKKVRSLDNHNIDNMHAEYKIISIMMAFLKQYEGHYWNDNESKWSENKTLFYTEREWRYVPLVQNGEAYYLDYSEFMNKEIRKSKRNELIRNGYVLKFKWEDIESIGVAGICNWIKICKSLKKKYCCGWIDVIKKVKLLLLKNKDEEKHNLF